MPSWSGSGVLVTSSTSTRGSHWASACRTASEIWPSRFAVIGSNSRSQIRQPNCGRISRSLGAVISTSRMLLSRPSTSSESRSAPVWSTCIGQEKPRPTKVGSGSSGRTPRPRGGRLSSLIS